MGMGTSVKEIIKFWEYMFDTKQQQEARKVHAENMDVMKSAICFYDIVKHLNSLAKERGTYEEEKKYINDFLEDVFHVSTILFNKHKWTDEMIQEFNDKVNEFWVIDEKQGDNI